MVLSGCGEQEVETFKKKTVSGNAGASKTKLNWIGHWFNEHNREVMVGAVAKEFSIRNPDIELKFKFLQNIREYRSKRDMAKLYAKMIRTGSYDWDVVWLDNQSCQYVADEFQDPCWGSKYLVDFGQVRGFKATQKGSIFDSPIWAAQAGGIIVGPMAKGYYHAIFYNKDGADNMGIKIKQFGMTFEDLLGYVKAVYDYDQKNGSGIAAFHESKDWTCQEILFRRLLKSEIGDFKKSLENKGSAEKNAAFGKTLEAFEKLGKYKPIIKNHKENIWFQTRRIPLTDEVSFYVNGIWMYSHWMSIDEEKIK